MVDVSFEWSQMPDLPTPRTYTPHQFRLYAVLDRLHWGRGRLKPWTFRAFWYRLISRYTHYNEWRFQVTWEANLKKQAKRIADEIDARIEEIVFDDAMTKAFAPNAEIQKRYDPGDVPLILRTPRPYRGDSVR